MSRSSGSRAITVSSMPFMIVVSVRDRQMRAVLLDRRDRQHGDRLLRVDRRIGGRREIAPPDASLGVLSFSPIPTPAAAITSISTLNSGRAKPRHDHQRRGRRRVGEPSCRAPSM